MYSKTMYPVHDDGTRYTPEEITAERDKIGADIRDTAMEIHSLQAQLRRARKHRDTQIASYIELYDGDTHEAARLALLDRTAVSKIINPKAGK